MDNIEELIKKLKDENSNVRGKAVLALGEIKDRRAVEPLIEALKDKNWEVRVKTAWVLGEMEDERAIPALEEALLKDKNDYVNYWAAKSLNTLKAKFGGDKYGKRRKGEEVKNNTLKLNRETI